MSPPRDWRDVDPVAPPARSSTPGWMPHVAESEDAGEGVRLTPPPPTPPSVPHPVEPRPNYDAGEAEFQRIGLDEIRNSDPGESKVEALSADEQEALASFASAPEPVRSFLARLAKRFG